MIVYFSVSEEKRLTLIIATLGLIVPFVVFVHAHQLQHIRLFKELFSEFNDRYSKINGALNNIVYKHRSEPLTSSEKQILYDYFNLCAEEYLYYRAGYIDHDVWVSWENGMRNFFRNEEVKSLWREEESSKSYYGLEIANI